MKTRNINIRFIVYIFLFILMNNYFIYTQERVNGKDYPGLRMAWNPREYLGPEFNINTSINSKYDLTPINVNNYSIVNNPMNLGYKIGASYYNGFSLFDPEYEINYLYMLNSVDVELKDLQGLKNNELIDIKNKVSIVFESSYINFNIYGYYKIYPKFFLQKEYLFLFQIFTGPEFLFSINSKFRQKVQIESDTTNVAILKHAALHYNADNRIIDNYEANIDEHKFMAMI